MVPLHLQLQAGLLTELAPEEFPTILHCSAA